MALKKKLPSLDPNEQKSLVDALRAAPPTEENAAPAAPLAPLSPPPDFTQSPDQVQSDRQGRGAPPPLLGTLAGAPLQQPQAPNPALNNPNFSAAEKALPPLTPQTDFTQSPAQVQADRQTLGAPPPLDPNVQQSQGIQNSPQTNAPPLTPPPAVPLSPLDKAQADYTKALSSKANKQGKAAQTLNFALQAIQHITNPNDNSPYEWLGNRKREFRIDQTGRTLAPLQAQEDDRLNRQVKQAQLGQVQAATDAAQQKSRIDLWKQMSDDDKESYRRLSDQQKNVLDVYRQQDEFDPNSETNKAFVEQAKKLGITLLPKAKGQKFTFQVAPDGRVIVGNSQTGDYRAGTETFSKPQQISMNEIPDSFFGLDDEKTISDKAAANVGQLPANRRIRPELSANLPADYKNEDGSVNEQKLVEDINQNAYGVRGLKLSDVYENIPSDYEQRLAGARDQLRGTQKERRANVDRWRTAISSQSPAPDAKQISLDTAMNDYKRILDLPKKQRDHALNIYFKDILPHIRIGR